MKRISLAFCFLFLFASVAVANAQVVDKWEFKMDGAFVEWTDSSGATWNYNNYRDGFNDVKASDKPAGIDGYRHLEWGDWDGWLGDSSSLTIKPMPGNGNSHTVITDGPAAHGLEIKHVNIWSINPIPLDLVSGEMMLSLSLNPFGSSDPASVITANLDFAFFETPNNVLNAFQSRDIFVLKDPSALTQIFEYNGEVYEIDFSSGLSQLTGWHLNYALNELGLPAGTELWGWTTRENSSYDFVAWLEIKHLGAATPEPATMMLMGAGLAGMAAMMRRRRKQ